MRQLLRIFLSVLVLLVLAPSGAFAKGMGFSISGAGGNVLGNHTAIRGMGRMGFGLSLNYVEVDLFTGFGAATFDQVPATGTEGYFEVGTQLRVYPLGSWGCRWACPYGAASVGWLSEIASDGDGTVIQDEAYDWFVTTSLAGGVELFPLSMGSGEGQFAFFTEVGRLWANGDGPDANLAAPYQDWRGAPYVLFGFRLREPAEGFSKNGPASAAGGEDNSFLLFSIGSAGFFGPEGAQLSETGGAIGFGSRHFEGDLQVHYAQAEGGQGLGGAGVHLRFFPESVPAGELALWPYGTVGLGFSAEDGEGRGHSYTRFLAGAGLELAVAKPSERGVGIYIETNYAASEARLFQNALGSPHAFCLRGGVRFRFGG